MGRSRIKAALFVLSAAALIAAPGAFSATPQEIYRDYADNGRLDRAYTPADLERALKNAAVQQYGKPGTGGLKPAVEEEIDSTPGVTSWLDRRLGRRHRRRSGRRRHVACRSRAGACRSPGSISVSSRPGRSG